MYSNQANLENYFRCFYPDSTTLLQQINMFNRGFILTKSNDKSENLIRFTATARWVRIGWKVIKMHNTFERCLVIGVTFGMLCIHTTNQSSKVIDVCFPLFVEFFVPFVLSFLAKSFPCRFANAGTPARILQPVFGVFVWKKIRFNFLN